MLLPFSRVWPLVAGLLLLPLLALADPLNNGALGVLVYVALFLAGLALLSPLLTVWSYFRPHFRVLYVLQLVLLAVGLWCGGKMNYVFRGEEFPLLGRFNPLWEVAMPVSIWLNAVMLARRARRDSARLVWGVVAVLALYHLLLVAPYAFLTASGWQWGAARAWALIGYQLLMLALLMSSWWGVLRQLGWLVLFWHPWWRAPLVFAGIELSYRVADWAMTNFFTHNLVLGLGEGPLLQAALSWIAGVVALRLVRPAAWNAPSQEV